VFDGEGQTTTVKLRDETPWSVVGSGDHSANDASAFQLLRYFDCNIDFDERQGAALLATLSAVPPTQRQEFFVSTVLSRRRSAAKWTGAPIAPYLQLGGLEDMQHVQALKAAINAILCERGLSALDLFAMMDANSDQKLNAQEIVGFLSTDERFRRSDSGALIPSPDDLAALKVPLMLFADRDMGGDISREEWAEFLGSVAQR